MPKSGRKEIEMSLFGIKEKKRIRELESQLKSQQQIIDQMLKLTERSLNAYKEANSIAKNVIGIAETALNIPEKEYKKTGA